MLSERGSAASCVDHPVRSAFRTNQTLLVGGGGMFSLGDSEIYYLSRTATDMRKGFDALCGEVRRGMGRDPVSGEVFIFYNSKRTRMKLLHWERGGFVIYHKRFERGILTLTRRDTRDAVIGSHGESWYNLIRSCRLTRAPALLSSFGISSPPSSLPRGSVGC